MLEHAVSKQKIEEETIVLEVFHASPHLMSQPNYKQCIANRLNHANGELGLWFSLNTTWIGGFGQHIYSFDLNLMDLKHKTISISELAEWSRVVDFDYQAKRLELLSKDFSVIFIEEKSSDIHMGIVLDFQAITNFKLTHA